MSGGNEAKLSDNLASVAHSLAGGLSGMISLAFLYPLETIKYQQQAAGVKCKKVLDELDVTLDDDENGNGVVKKITPQQSDAEEEIMGAQWSDLLKQKFYRTAYTGLGISLFETGCFHGTHFYFHTLLKKRWTRLNPGSEMSPWVSLMNGSLAALIVQLVTSPLKVLQINSVLYKDKSLINIATTVLRNHGIMGFWTGFNLKSTTPITYNPQPITYNP